MKNKSLSEACDTFLLTIHWLLFLPSQIVEQLLTYDLYYVKEQPFAVPDRNPFYQQLHDAMNNSSFMCKGGCLGFQCEHSYPFSELNKRELLPFLLKGAEYMVFTAARAIGLKVRVQPTIEGSR